MKKQRFAAITLALTATACGNGNLPDYVRLGDLRILALKADKPEVSPGDSVSITPVVSDLNLGRSMTYSAEACIDPGVGYGATPSCAGSASRVVLASSSSIPAVGTAKKTSTGTAPALSVTVPSTILANRSPVDQYNGVAYLVIYTLTAAPASGATSQVVSFKRVVATTRTPRDSNPSITDVIAGSQSLSGFLSALTYPGTAQLPVTLTPVLGAGSAESYTLMNANGSLSTQTETLTTTWFISDGAIEYFRTLASSGNDWTPPGAQPKLPDGTTARGIVFVAVTRDGRGGEDFKQIEY